MNIDNDKIADTTLALLYLSLHDSNRVWKQHDWDALNALHEKGLIYNPVGKAKSVQLTDEGVAKSEALFKELFTSPEKS